MEIYIGANAAKLEAFATELLDECRKAKSDAGDYHTTIDVPMYAHANHGDGEEVTISFSNDDMENREDLDPDLILVDVDR